MNILFLQTGGTIDKDYFEKVKGYAFKINKPAVKSVLSDINPNFIYTIKTVLKKDSLDITHADRMKIRKICMNAVQDKIIITHGTDTMVETAKVLSDISGKVIIFTGAFIPEKFRNSDAAFNIGVAVGAAGIFDEGVFVAMNGRVYPYNNVLKDQTTGQFIERNVLYKND